MKVSPRGIAERMAVLSMTPGRKVGQGEGGKMGGREKERNQEASLHLKTQCTLKFVP